MTNEELIAFVREHRDEDPLKLLLQQGRYPEVDMRQVAQQIEGVRQASTKWPTLAACEGVLYPPKLNREQSSSETTAKLKAEILLGCYSGEDYWHRFNSGTELITMAADLTGGMGIDSMALARVAKHVDYIERDAELCRIMEHNCEALGINNISIHCEDSIDWLAKKDLHFDAIIVDPARRDSHGRKVAAFEDCTPNIVEQKELIADKCEWLMVKASPMIDIDIGVKQLGCVREVHVVAVRGECKEVVFVGKVGEESEEAVIYAHNIIMGGGQRRQFRFRRSEEAAAEATYCRQVKRYLYEPDAALMKCGPYKLLCDNRRFEKLDRNTHLYTSDELEEWSGRVFTVVGEVRLDKKTIVTAIPDRKAHVMVRNYPAEAAALQKKLGLSEGGELFVVATTVAGERKGFVCRAG